MFRSLRIRHRLLLTLVAAVLGLAAVSAAALVGIRQQMLDDRKQKVRELVQTAVDTVAFHHRLAESGVLSQEDAKRQARDALRDMRFGAGDYFFAYTLDGTCLVLGPAQKREGTVMLDVADRNGVKIIADLIAVAKAGGGFVAYDWPRGGSEETFPKLSFAAPFAPWGWVVGTGVYIDDLDAAFTAAATRLSAAIAVVVLVVAAGNLWVGRSIARPLSRLTAAMTRLAGGDNDAEVPFAERRDEIGELAQAMSTFRETARERVRLEEAQEAQKRLSAEERRRAMAVVADRFEADVGGVVEALGGSAADMQATSAAMSATAEETSRQASTVSESAGEASANVQTVASAAEQLAASIAEIDRRVQRSNEVTKTATEEAERTRGTVRDLAAAADRIGRVVDLINGVAQQTNLLALNATIEAARAGEAGRGFAVVAGEVKTLANQTAKATDEIATQIETVRREIEGTVQAIEGIVATIGEIGTIASSIGDAVEEQSHATRDIARSVEAAARGTHDVNLNIAGVSAAADETGTASERVLHAASLLSQQADDMRRFVESFLADIRAA